MPLHDELEPELDPPRITRARDLSHAQAIQRRSRLSECGSICNASVLYGAHLRFLRYDLNAWRRDEPNDWNLWKRMWGAGVRMGFVDRVLGKHFLEHWPPRPATSGRR